MSVWRHYKGVYNARGNGRYGVDGKVGWEWGICNSARKTYRGWVNVENCRKITADIKPEVAVSITLKTLDWHQ